LEKPDIILVSIDSLRRDHLPMYGYPQNTSPKLASWESLRFSQARSASPWTLPAHMTMLTGLWPYEHGVIEDDRKLGTDIPTLAEQLQGAGYATGGFVSTIYVSKSYGFGRGFDEYNDFGILERNNLEHPVRAEEVVAAALEWARKQTPGKPIFLFLHFYDVHYPYSPPAPWNTSIDPAASEEDLHYKKYAFYKKHPPTKKRFTLLINQYDECIAYVDSVLQSLKNTWGGRKSDWAITADHGEEFGERGSWGHAHTLYPEVLDIPLFFSGPDFTSGVREELVGHIDLAPTLAGLAGVKFAPGDGVDLRGAVPERLFLAETSRFESAKVSLEAQGRRLELDVAGALKWLFDRKNDPKELQPFVEGTAMLEALLVARLGEPCRTSGVVAAKAGVGLWQRGNRVEQVREGSFLVVPIDAFDADTQVVCRSGAGKQVLDPGIQAQLEALGYTQSEEPVKQAPP
jgi:arylsulfatase A-like enzyme